MPTTPGHVVVRLQLSNTTAALAETVAIEIMDAGIAVLNAPQGAMQSATYEFDVQPGTWNIEVRNEDNQLVGNNSVSISTAGVVAAQPIISITENTPVVTKLNRHSGLAGDTVVATGLHMNRIRSAAFTGATQATVMATGNMSVAFVIPTGAMTGPLDVTYLSSAKRVQASDFFSMLRVYYVRTCLADGGGCPPDGGSGISFDDALGTVPDSIAGVQPGSEIWIAEGTYAVSRQLRFQGTSVLGGFSTSNPERNPALRQPLINRTILDGNNTASIAETAGALTIDGVSFTRGKAVSTSTIMTVGGALDVLGALTISRCTMSSHENGAIRVSGQLVMRDCLVRDNTTDLLIQPSVAWGGRMSFERTTFINNSGGRSVVQVENSTLSLRDCHFESNTPASSGTALKSVLFLQSAASIQRTLFFNHLAADAWWGMIFVQSPSVSMRDVVILNNVALAGGVILAQGDLVVENSVWIGNQGVGGGNASLRQEGGSLTLLNNTFSEHTRFAFGAAAILRTGGTLTMANNLFYNTPNTFNLTATANAQGNIELPNGAYPFLTTFTNYNAAELWGPDAIPFTRDDAYVLIPSNANALIDKGVSTGTQVDIHGTARPFDHPGVISGTNGTTFDIGASEAL